MTRARILVCERTGEWAECLRRELLRSDMFATPQRTGDSMAELVLHALREIRSLPECWEELERAPHSFVVVELTRTQLESQAGFLAQIAWRYPGARTAAVGDRTLAESEGVLRELGVAAFTVSPREVQDLTTIAVRHLAAQPVPRPSPLAAIWSRLPWKRYAVRNSPPAEENR